MLNFQRSSFFLTLLTWQKSLAASKKGLASFFCQQGILVLDLQQVQGCISTCSHRSYRVLATWSLFKWTNPRLGDKDPSNTLGTPKSLTRGWISGSWGPGSTEVFLRVDAVFPHPSNPVTAFFTGYLSGVPLKLVVAPTILPALPFFFLSIL